jgi:hypothetical protein
MAKPSLAATCRAARVLAAAGAVVLAGCRGDGLSDYDRMKQAQQTAGGSLESQGAKLKEMHYPQGSAWSVNLSGVTITDETIRQVKALGRVSELNLSKSSVTDDQLGLIQQQGLTTLLLKVDLSHTAITDAGLGQLDNLVLLNHLNLTGTKVTPSGVERFRRKHRANPNTKFKDPNIHTS